MQNAELQTRKIPKIAAWICQLTVLVVGVAGGAIASPGSIEFDSKLTAKEQMAISEDLTLLSSFPLNGSDVPYFNEIFGGPSNLDVLRYIVERVNWIISPSANLDTDIVTLPLQMNSPVVVVATNIGTAIWYQSVADRVPDIGLIIGTTSVPIKNSRVGLIQLGKDYSDFIPLFRISTLIHEARHSDCTGGLAADDIVRLHLGKAPLSNTCGHLHSECPAGHDYENLHACDDHPWGAYSVQFKFLAAYIKSCTSCSIKEQNLALALFADATSRVLVLDDMLSGKYGNPDMSSAEVPHS